MSRAPPPAPYKPGDLLGNGRYAVVCELNRGATAVVYAARDLHVSTTTTTTTTKVPPRLVALKVMDCPAHVPVRALKREIALSAAVGQHPNLVPLLDVFAASRREMVIVWEKVEGGDLLELLNEVGPFQEDRAAFLTAQLLRAVAFLHSSGFAHRDIKPENCLVEREGERLRLIDFGLSKHIASVATLGVGTPDYMAPELLQQPSSPPPAAAPTTHTHTPTSAQAAYDARAADAWALGVLLFLLLAGAYPFEDERHPSSVAHTVANVLAGRRRAWPEWVSQEGRRVVEGLLRSDAAARTTLRELASDPWLAQGAKRYASGVPGGPALVNLSSVAAVVPAAVVVEEAVVPANEQEERQEQVPPAPAAPPVPAPQPPKQGLLQRLMAGLRVK